MNVVLNFLLLLCYCQFLSLCLLLFIHIYLCVPMLDCETESEKGFPGGSASKESACNAGNPGSIPGLGRSPGSIPELGRSPGEGIGYPLQYPCLENPMDGGAWEAAVHGVSRSWT